MIKNFFAKIVLVIMMGHFSCNSPIPNTFLSEIGVCTKIGNANMLSTYGYTYIEESVGGFLIPDRSKEEFNIKLEQASLTAIPIKACNIFIPGRYKSVGNDVAHLDILEYVETAFKRAQIAGVEYIVFGSGGSRGIPEGFSRNEARQQFIDLCSQMAPLAAKYNVVVVLEPLNTKECNFINSVSEGGEIVKEVDHPNFRLLVDIYHMLMEGESPENIKKYGHLIHHVHIAEKEDRAAPGTHNEDFTKYFEALKNIGYMGKMSIECNWEDMETQSATAIQTIRNQLSTLK